MGRTISPAVPTENRRREAAAWPLSFFAGVQIAYLRGTGRYGAGSKQLMEALKSRLRAMDLFDADTTILGIALDDPARTPEDQQRYDVGVVLSGTAEALCRAAASMMDPLPSLRSPTWKRACQISGRIFRS